MSRPISLLCAAACALLLAACGEDDQEAAATRTATPAPAQTAPAQTEPAAGCRTLEEPEAKPEGDLPEPDLKLDAGTTYVATVLTSCGTFEITLDAERAPITGGSFASLARKGFFDDTIFHRVIPGFVIQGGDPKGDGTGGPGYQVVEEPPSDLSYEKGVVAMAKGATDPAGASGSQFYVVVGPDGGQLPPAYALLGKVTKGIEVTDLIAAQPIGESDRPTEPVIIESIRIREE